MWIRISLALALLPAPAAIRPCAAATNQAAVVALDDVLCRYGFPPPRIGPHALSVRSKYTALRFEPGSRKLLYNDMLIMMNAPLRKTSAGFCLAREDIDGVLAPLLRASDTLRPLKVRRVVLDPGHGGMDSGALDARNYPEKKLTLDLAQRTAARLRHSDVKTILTRTRDTALSLDKRTALARKWKADLFVSLHLNASPKTSPHGLETYLLPSAGYPSTAENGFKTAGVPGNDFDAANMLLAYYLHKSVLQQAGMEDRGIRRARFQVLREAPCPAILIEAGFMSNRREAALLRSREHRDRIAEGLARGILTFVTLANEE
jgi:N-acetylmuramoyl-L-alanine amidase